MATVKKSKKKKIVWAVIAVVLVAAIVVASVVISTNKNKQQVSLNTIGLDTIVQTVSSTGEVTSGLKRDYTAGTIATVKEVFVKVGDSVSKGDRIATFDTSNLDAQVSNLAVTYNDAQAAYNTALKNQNEAKAQLASVNSQIASLESSIDSMASENNKKKTAAASASKGEEQTYSVDYNSGVVTYADGTLGGITGGTDDIQKQLKELIDNIKDLTGSIDKTNQLVQALLEELSKLGDNI